MRTSTRWLVEMVIVCGVGAGNAARCAAAVAPGDSLAEPPVAWSTTYASWYSFQGLDYSERKPVLQPQASASLGGFSVSGWGNVDQTRHEFNEVDLGVQREWNPAPATLAVGYVYLWYPHRDWEATHELLADLSIEAPLSPTLSLHWDVAAGRGRYWALGLNQALPWRGDAVTLGARLNVHDHYYEMNGIPAVETNVTIASGWSSIAIEPTLSHFWAWDNGDFRDDVAVRGGWMLSVACSSR